MGAKPLSLDELLESVADGNVLDWDALDAAAETEQDRRMVRHLRLVAGIADVHRTVPLEDPADLAPLPQIADADQSVPRWGHLLLVERVGEGAFGEVYRARDPWLDREVALKLLKKSAANPRRLVVEGQALARVRHSNVVTVHGADIHDGRAGLWMEFVPGQTLSSIVAANGPMNAPDAVAIGRDLCRALAAVHAAGLVHHDIKAQNVMRESSGRVVLMDFGAGHTPLYLAPELLAGGDATVASDIYATGVLLHYLVTAKFPVTGAGIEELKEAHARGDRRSVAELRPELQPALAATIDKALDPNPERRFRSAFELQEALTHVIAPATTNAPSSVEPRPYFLRRGTWAAAAAVLAAAVAVGAWWRGTPPPAASPNDPIRLIAVMPLLNQTGDRDYFADGMTEALTQELAAAKALRVVSRTSVDRARDMGDDLATVARTLGADALLEGSVNRAGDTVRINVRLIHAGSNTAVWAESFVRTMSDIFALQRDIAHAVAGELEATIHTRSTTLDAVDPTAHDLYLRGRYFLVQQTVEGANEAISLFEQAARIDPRHARAHAGIAEAYLSLGSWYVLRPAEAFQKCREAVERALAIDDTVAEAHAVRAAVLFEHDWNWTEAEREFKRALELNPSLEFASERYSMFLAARGRVDAALTHIADARRVDPLSPLIAASAGGILRYARRYDEAVDQFNRALRTHPDFLSANVGLARTLNALGRHDDAIVLYEALSRRGFNPSLFALEIAQADAAAGRVDRARHSVEETRKRAEALKVALPPEYLAYAYASVGNFDEAFRWLDEAFLRKSASVLWLTVDNRADPLRKDPRFREYLEKLGVAS
jgi:TolB-like protein/Tfp pilus assembly protein PilF/tRNA A-37 threonylcarbamoyl transferase component Bud32